MKNSVAHQQSLASATAATFLKWQEDESLFSLASRYHMLSCNSRAQDTCRQLFGHPRVGTAHDFSARVGIFAERTEFVLGSAQDIIQHHTILPYFLAFVDRTTASNAIASLLGSSTGNLKAKLGMLASRMGAAHPLKACPECMKSDKQLYGTAHWRTTHQLPGAWMCVMHKIRLCYTSIKVSGVERFGWFLPRAVQHLPLSISDLPHAINDKLEKLALGATHYWSRPVGTEPALELVVRNYWHQLKQLGLATDNERLRHQAFGAFMKGTVAGLRELPEFRAIPLDADKCALHFSDMLTVRRCPRHPLKHLLFQLALYGECGLERVFAPQADALTCLSSSNVMQIDVEWMKKKNQCIDQMLNQMLTPTAVARQSGVALATVMAWAAQAGVKVKRRPKVLVDSLRQRLVDALKCGEDKDSAATKFGVSIQTITTTLRTEPGLANAWRQARFALLQQDARAGILEAASSLPGCGIKAIRQVQPACYAWLYRSDRAWLDEFVKALPSWQPMSRTRVCWDERDRALASAVQVAALAIAEKQANRRVTVAQICQVVPDLKRLMSKLNRLPLCRSAIAQAVRRAEASPLLLC